MLTQLRIADLAVIDSAEIQLSRGFNVLTGETGAGKSMVVTAAELIRGGRATADLVRQGAKQATVEAIFDISNNEDVKQRLRELDLDAGDELLVRRVIAKNGRGRAYINGSLSTASLLAQVTPKLIDIAGQNEHQSLSERATQRRILDKLALPAGLAEQLSEQFSALTEIAEELNRKTLDEQQRLERSDFLRFQLEELDRAQLSAGEDQHLAQQLKRLQRASELQQTTASADDLLYSNEHAVVGRLSSLERELRQLVSADPALEPLVNQLQEARISLEDLATSLARYADSVDLDPQQLQQVEERMDLIYRLKRKHGSDLDQIIEKTEQLRAELAQLDNFESHQNTLQQRLADAQQTAWQLAQQCTDARSQAGEGLAREVAGYLAQLGMPAARFVVGIDAQAPREGSNPALTHQGRQLNQHGWDQISFRFSANAGHPPCAIGKVASGGELSRLMLALRQALGKADQQTTCIYDEVDTGISGSVADVVGRLLAQVAKDRQVICVTHLPQVSAYADQHLIVEKTLAQDSTSSRVRSLSEKQRVDELARMLAASEVTKQARANARQLLKAAQAAA